MMYFNEKHKVWIVQNATDFIGWEILRADSFLNGVSTVKLERKICKEITIHRTVYSATSLIPVVIHQFHRKKS